MLLQGNNWTIEWVKPSNCLQPQCPYSWIVMQRSTINNIHNVWQRLQSLVLNNSHKRQIPTENRIREFHEIHHISLHIMTDPSLLDIWETYLKRTLPTPHILPKFHSKPITYLILNIMQKHRPTLPNGLPQTHSIWARYWIRAPAPPITSILNFDHPPPKHISLVPKSP